MASDQKYLVGGSLASRHWDPKKPREKHTEARARVPRGEFCHPGCREPKNQPIQGGGFIAELAVSDVLIVSSARPAGVAVVSVEQVPHNGGMRRFLGPRMLCIQIYF